MSRLLTAFLEKDAWVDHVGTQRMVKVYRKLSQRIFALDFLWVLF